MKGIDYTTQTTAVQAKALKSAGYGFVCRYLVPVSMSWKRLTKSEVDIISSEGLQIVSVYESTENRASLGAAQGMIDGKIALAEAKIVSQPLGSTIYFAVDYDAQSKDFNAIEAYLKAAQSQITGYNVGVYGSYYVVEEMFKRGIKFHWQTYAWSSGKKSTHTNVYQYKNGISDCGISGDADNSFGGEGFWNVKLVVAPVVPPKPLTWQEIINKSASAPAEWVNAIDVAINAANANGDLGTLEIFKYLPDLIVKAYQYGKDGK